MGASRSDADKTTVIEALSKAIGEKQTTNWCGKSATTIIVNNTSAGWTISMVKTKQDEGYKTGMCLRVSYAHAMIVLLWKRRK